MSSQKNKKEGKGKELENHLATLMKLFTPRLWPSRSGTQNGYDAYAIFSFNERQYQWKFECKDLNRNKHVKSSNFDNVEEIEIKDFSEKIMQLMGMSDDCYPHVFCLFIPHKRIGNNNNLRDNIASWNKVNKFPFKIIIWDFDFLKDKIPYLNIPSADAIYPNAPNINKELHEQKLNEIKNELRKESIKGFMHNRSYIDERRAKDTVYMEGMLFIKIKESSCQSFYEFEADGHCFKIHAGNLLSFRLCEYPVTSKVDLKNGLTTTFSEIPIFSESIFSEDTVFDSDEYDKIIENNKKGIIDLFKIENDKSTSLFNIIQNHGMANNARGVSFILPQSETQEHLARLPLKELDSSDFGITKAISFNFGYDIYE